MRPITSLNNNINQFLKKDQRPKSIWLIKKEGEIKLRSLTKLSITNSDPMSFLGVGWKFPVQTSSDHMIQMSSYEEDIKEAIRIILQTAKGDRVMRPGFGCGIKDFVFASLNTSELHRMESSVREDLTLWEPRIQLTNVTVLPDDTDLGKVFINIDYTVRATNTQSNMVYPFFLTEG